MCDDDDDDDNNNSLVCLFCYLCPPPIYVVKYLALLIIIIIIIHKLMKRLLTGERALSRVMIISLSFIALLFCLLFSIVLFNAQQVG